MVAFNITLEDTSPLLAYNGNWNMNSSDQYIQNYSGSTFHQTRDYGDNVTFSFFGSAIFAYGSRRPHHGEYMVMIDDQIVETSAFSSDPTFNQLLFSQALNNTNHTLTIKNVAENAPRLWLDIDQITFTSGDDKNETDCNWSWIDGDDHNLQWSSGWSKEAKPDFALDDRQHYSWSPGSSVHIPFNGSAVRLFGFTHPHAALYTVSIDGNPPMHMNASSSVWNNGSTLFFASGLADGSHSLNVTHSGTKDTFISIASIQSASYVSITNPPSGDRHVQTLIIVAVVMLGLGVLGFIATMIYVLRGRRKRNAKPRVAPQPRPYLLIPNQEELQPSQRPPSYGYGLPQTPVEGSSKRKLPLAPPMREKAVKKGVLESGGHDKFGSYTPLLEEARAGRASPSEYI